MSDLQRQDIRAGRVYHGEQNDRALTRQVCKCGLISFSKSTSMSILAGGGTPIEMGGGSTAKGGRLADDVDSL